MPFLTYAQNEMGKGLSDTAIKNKFLSTVKDVEVEKILGGSTEFNDCRKDKKFLSDDDKGKRDKKLADASICFKQKLSGKSEAELKKLSSSLGLDSYGLVKSNSVNDISEYLQNKMTKSLTGKDPAEKDPKKILEQMKWKNQKIVDQKVFVDLYKNQLMKNALFEVSRYCFEDLRITSKNDGVFSDHWSIAAIESVTASNGDVMDIAINDQGKPSFFDLKGADTSDKQALTETMVKSLSSNGVVEPALYEKYFKFCSAALPKLCEKYKKSASSKSNDETSTMKAAGSVTDGSKSCLVLDRLRNLRKAMEDTAKVAKQMDEMDHVDGKLALQMLDNPVIFGSKSDESLDQLTSYSSTDMLVGSEKNKDLEKLKKDCETGKGGSKCDEYLVEGDGLQNSLSNIEVEMTLKRDAEVERVKLLKGKVDDLKAYLTENGMFDLLNRLESNDQTLDIEVEIGKIYDARKLAMVEGLKNKVGKRQLTESEVKAETNIDNIKADNVKVSMEEKARLAQVVMFNNIITSQLDLEDSKGTKLGRNVTAWNKEIKGITKDGGMKDNDKLFSGLQGAAKGVKAIDNASLGDGGIIDTILGKKAD